MAADYLDLGISFAQGGDAGFIDLGHAVAPKPCAAGDLFTPGSCEAPQARVRTTNAAQLPTSDAFLTTSLLMVGGWDLPAGGWVGVGTGFGTGLAKAGAAITATISDAIRPPIIMLLTFSPPPVVRRFELGSNLVNRRF
jgi:hypothetical protein